MKKDWSLVVSATFLLPWVLFAPLFAQEIQVKRRPLLGQQLFVSRGCVKCHAIFGNGGRVGSDLGRTQSDKKTLDIIASMWNHSSEMNQAMVRGESIPQLDPEEMSALLSFFYYLKFFGQPGDPDRGATIFLEKKCSTCHVIGEGYGVGPNLSQTLSSFSPLSLGQKMWNHGWRMIDEMRNRRIPIPVFKENEMSDLISFLKSVSTVQNIKMESIFPGDADRGATLVKAKNCIRCHRINGRGGTIGPDFDQLDFSRSAAEIAAMMWNHAPNMWRKMREQRIDIPEFSGNDLADLLAYLYFLDFRVLPGDVKLGQAVFQQKQCNKCHSLQFQAKRIGPNLLAVKGLDDMITISSAMWNHNIKMQEEMRRQQIPFPRFTGEDLKNLLTFIQSVRKQELQEE